MVHSLPSVGNPSLFDKSFEVTDRGGVGLGVFVQDQTTPTLSTPFLQPRTPVTLASNTVIDTRTLTLEPGHGTLVGETLEIAEVGTNKYMQAKVVAVSVDVITLDSLINRVYVAGAGTLVLRSTDNLLVDGSVTPQIFSVAPLPDQSGDMTRVIFGIQGSAAMDHSTFGSDAALTNGLLVRVKLSDGTYQNVFNFKNNGDIIRQGLDNDFLVPKGGNAIHAFAARVTWGGQDKHGAVIRVDGSLGEELQLVVQDNLTGGLNTVFGAQGQGSELQGE